MELQVEHHFWSVTLRLMVSVAPWIVGDMSKEGFVTGTVIIVEERLYLVILHAVALKVAKR